MAEQTILGNYEILAKVGAGAMGTVYKARQLSLDRIVALKILPRRLAADGEFLARFLREAQSAAQCSHPNLIQVHDVGQAGGYYFYSMEFVGGPTLKQVLAQHGPLAEKVALGYMVKIAAALEEAHEKDIVHRDVKPDNILLTERGEPKLADLGLAKPLRSEADVTLDGTSVGTPHYMSPEQVRGEPVDGRADLYALGATFFHLLTGETLFQGPTSGAVMVQHSTARPRPVRELRPELSRGIEAILLKLLAKRPGERYPGAKDLMADLRLVAGGGPPKQARPVAAVGRGPARAAEHVVPARSRKSSVLGVAGILVVVVLVAALAAVALAPKLWPQTRQGSPKSSPGATAPEDKAVAKADAQAAPGAAFKAGKPEAPAVAAGGQAREMLDFARDYAAKNPEAFAAAVSLFEKAGAAGKGSLVEVEAQADIERLRKSWREKAEAGLAERKRAAEQLGGQADYDGALAELGGLAEPLRQPVQAELQAARDALSAAAQKEVKELLGKAEAALAAKDGDGARQALARLHSIRFSAGPPPAEQLAALDARLKGLDAEQQAASAQQARARSDRVLGEFEDKLQRGDYSGARTAMQSAAAEPDHAPLKETLLAATRVAELMAGRSEAVHRGLKARMGQRVTLATAKGEMAGKLDQVTDQGVDLLYEVLIGGRVAGSSRHRVPWDWLKPAEVERLATEGGWSLQGPDGQILQTYMALWQKDAPRAQAALTAAGEHPLALLLRERVERLQLGEAELAAQEAWAAIEKRYAGLKLTPADGEALLKALTEFEAQHGKSRRATEVADKVAALKDQARKVQIVPCLKNGGFEAGTLDGWGSSDGRGKVAVTADANAPEGKFLLSLLVGRNTTLNQDLDLEAGEAYRASLKAKLVEKTTSEDARLTIRTVENKKDHLGGVGMRVTEMGINVWRDYTFYFVPSQAKVSLEASEYGASPPFKLLLDDIQVTRLPHPVGAPADAARFGKNAYKVFEIPVSWEGARNFCEKRGGHLVTISDKKENEFVGSLADKARHDVWLGLFTVAREGAEWKWVTGEQVGGVFWRTGFPRYPMDNNYAYMTKEGVWCNGRSHGDDRWETPYPICEWEPGK